MFIDAHVGSNTAVTVNGFTPSGADAGKYNIVQPTGLTASIRANAAAARSALVSVTPPCAHLRANPGFAGNVEAR